MTNTGIVRVIVDLVTTGRYSENNPRRMSQFV